MGEYNLIPLQKLETTKHTHILVYFQFSIIYVYYEAQRNSHKLVYG